MGCRSDFEQKCLTCGGYPDGHPECNGVPWGQTFTDIPRSMWFMFVTVSTVGYGDVSPTTWQGQIFVCIVIICGLIFLAMPLAIVGSTFGQVWDERQIFKLQRHLRQLLAENGIDVRRRASLQPSGLCRSAPLKGQRARVPVVSMQPNDAVVAFKKMDTDGTGAVSYDEFRGFVLAFKMNLEAEEVKEVRTRKGAQTPG